MKYIDLTHKMFPEMPSWDGDNGFSITIETDYKDCTPPDLFRTNNIQTRAGMGTHIDAPAHCIEGGRTVDQLTFEELITDCVVIDVSSDATETYVVLPEVIEKFEQEHGAIQPGAFVIFYTGWSKKWDDRTSYHNGHKFPSVAEATAKLLLERNIAGIGIDSFSTDTGRQGFPVHRAVLGAGKYLVENIANADKLPAKGAKTFAIPLHMRGATESPLRLFAEIE